MTFFLINTPESSQQSQGVLEAAASATANVRMPCSSITHTGLTVNGSGQLVLSSGYTHILTAAPYMEGPFASYGTSTGSHFLVTQWYDVTNSQWLGVQSRLACNYSNNTYDKRGSVARCLVTPSVSTTVEARIVSVVSTGTLAANLIVNEFTYTASIGRPANMYGSPWYSVISF